MFPTTSDIATLPARDRVHGAIARAAERTGVDFSYLVNQARVESGMNPDARARTSSATGLYQFIDQTWLATVHKHGRAHGLGWAADAIRRGPDGRFHADPATRHAILDLRRQPEAASAMAAEFASDNRDFLEARIGRTAEPVDLYLAHFLGAGGAARFLAAHDSNPNAAAAHSMPAAARANRPVFYHRGGAPKSFAEIRAHFARRMGQPAGPAPMSVPVRRAAAPQEAGTAARLAAAHDPAAAPMAGPTPQYARLAYLMLAQLGG